jgi:hypothetical protein
MTLDRGRLAGLALMIGGILTIAGYAAANTFAGSSGDARFSNPLWIPLYSVALAGDLITLLGLPAILTAHGQRAYRLTTVGFAGVLLTIVMLNIGEGTTEAFIKPYLATHGGIPNVPPVGFEVFVAVALVFLLVGLISLGVAVIRARAFPRWVGGLLILSVPLSAVPLPGPLAEIGDYLAFFALAVIGWIVVFGHTSQPASTPDLARSAQASA